MTRLISLIETGSYSSKDDLTNLISTLKSRIRRGKKELRNGPILLSKIDDLNEASIYLEEFKKLKEQL